MKTNIIKIISATLFVLVALGQTGCSLINIMVTPTTDITLISSKDINPNTEMRPSPVVIKIFELSSRSVFDTQDFFSLYSKASETLGPDLISELEIELQPVSTKSLELSLNSNTRYVGIIVAFQDIDNSGWRSVVAVDPKGYDSFTFDIKKLSIYSVD